MRPCHVISLGLVSYDDAWELQRRLVALRQDGRVPDVLLLLEHPPVFTVGRAGRAEHLLLPEHEYERLGALVRWVDRGGDVTFHGPGQLVGYPVLDLRAWRTDSHAYLRAVEEVLVRVCFDFGVPARGSDRYTGVWVGDAKIAALGVKISRWVTSHGFALNVSTDLEWFEQIVPCGIVDRGVTSLSRCLGVRTEREVVETGLLTHFSTVFERDVVVSTIEHLIGLASVTAER